MQSNNVSVFVSPTGRKFVFAGDIDCGADLIYSSDGKIFKTLVRHSFSGTSAGGFKEFEMSFKDPSSEFEGRMRYKDDVITFDREEFALTNEMFDVANAIPIPHIPYTEYLCEAGDGTLFYISRPEYKWDYESFRLFIGDGVDMREVPITSVQRYRDGGTTFVVTDEGTFLSPTQVHDDMFVQWGDDAVLRTYFNSKRNKGGPDSPSETVLKRLDPKNFNIVEDGDRVRIMALAA